MPRVILSLILISLSAGTIRAERLREPFDRSVEVRPGGRVAIDNVNGRITVSAWDQPRVRIHAVRKAQSREALDKLTIDVRQNGSELAIVTRMPKRGDGGFFDTFFFGDEGGASVDYEVTVPSTTDLRIENTNGSVAISEIRGNIRLASTNGRLEAVRCSGTIHAETTNGSIRAELLEVASGKPMRFETTNGSIALIVPPTFAADVEAQTTNGSIRTDLPVTTKSFSRRELRGTINGGGAALVLYTTNGSIEVRSNGADR